MKELDRQLAYWSQELVADVKIKPEDSKKLATTIAKEVRWLKSEHKHQIVKSSPVKLSDRYDEILAFQAFMEFANTVTKLPPIVRAQVITQNYMCFIYLNESCFRVLENYLPAGSTSEKCCNFLINNPIQTFRNAIIDSNWCYNDDFTGLKYWAKKGTDPNEPLSEFEVGNRELGFWQTLSRGVASASYEHLK